MTRSPLIKAIWALFIALFITMQGFSQAHAISNGGDDHSHDGVACDIVLVSAEQTLATPPIDNLTPPILPSRETGFVAFTSVAYLNFSTRAPPSRGPPL